MMARLATRTQCFYALRGNMGEMLLGAKDKAEHLHEILTYHHHFVHSYGIRLGVAT